MRKTNINIQITLDDDQMPHKIHWTSDDDDQDKSHPAKALLLSLFDEESKDTVKVDLWTNEMQLVEMDRFMFQTLKSLADTYFKSTNNNQLASHMQQFAQYFGEQVGIIKKEGTE